MQRIAIVRPPRALGWWHIKVNGKAVGQLKTEKCVFDNLILIRSFKIKKKYRNQGYGRRLLFVVVKALRNENYACFLNCQPKNKVAHHLYESLGFKTFKSEYDWECIKWDYMSPYDLGIYGTRVSFIKTLLPKDRNKHRR